MRDEPDCPPLVLITGGGEDQAAFLLAWEVRETAPSEWSAWVAWVRETGGRPRRHVTTILAARLRPQPQDHPQRVAWRPGIFRHQGRPPVHPAVRCPDNSVAGHGCR
jgi:hypothetical protein